MPHLPLGRVFTLLGGFALALVVARLLAWGGLAAFRSASGSQVWGLIGRLRRHAAIVDTAIAARLDPRQFTGLPLTIMTVAALCIAGLLGALTAEVIGANAALRFDRAVTAGLASFRGQPLVGLFRWITALGTGPDLTAVLVTATAFLWADRRISYILPLWVTFLGAQATTWSAKYLIARHRPAFIAGITEASPSFPSGHATASMALFGFIAYAIGRDLTSGRARFEVGFWAAALIALIGFSRVFLSLHFSTDVLAGFLVGLFWLLVGLALREWRPGTGRR